MNFRKRIQRVYFDKVIIKTYPMLLLLLLLVLDLLSPIRYVGESVRYYKMMLANVIQTIGFTHVFDIHTTIALKKCYNHFIDMPYLSGKVFTFKNEIPTGKYFYNRKNNFT